MSVHFVYDVIFSLLSSAVNTSRVISLRTEMISFMREAKKEGRMKNVGRGKGLVFTAGNAVRFCYSTTYHVDRASRSRITMYPIQIND